MAVAGSFFYLYLAKFFRPVNILTAGFVVSLIGGLLLLSVGGRHPMLLLLSTAAGTICAAEDKVGNRLTDMHDRITSYNVCYTKLLRRCG